MEPTESAMTADDARRARLGPELVAHIHRLVDAAPPPPPEVLDKLRPILARPGLARHTPDQQ